MHSTSRLPAPIQSLWNAAYLLLALTALFWAGNSVIGRAARDLVPPVTLAFWRWALAFLLVLGFAWPHLRRDLPELRRRWRITALLSFLGLAAFHALLYTGLQTTTAINSLLIQAAMPPVILLCAFLISRERTRPVQMLGVFLSLVGVATIVTKGELETLLHFRFNRGDALTAVGVWVYALYTVLLRRRPMVHPLSFLAATFALGALFLLPFYLLELSLGARIVPGMATAGVILYVAVFPSLIAYLCFNRGVELVGPGRAGQVTNIMPVFGATLAILFLGERFQLFHAAGMALIAAGIPLATRRAG